MKSPPTQFSQKEILLLSWVDEQMRFAVVREGESVATWECPGEPEDLVAESFKLAPILRKAVAETGYQGKKLGIVLEHGRLTHQLLATPPAKGRDLELFIERQVDQLKVVDDEVVMAWMDTEPIKSSKGLVLSLFPRPLQEKLIAECREAKLHLLLLIAPTVLLREHLADLPIDDDGVAMIAARTGNKTSVLIGRKGGEFFLARTLRCNWSDSPQRLNSELNKSTIFLRQQYGRDIDSIWLTGEGAAEHMQRMQGGEDEQGGPGLAAELPVKVSPVEHNNNFWGRLMARVPADTPANLISREQRDAPRRKLFVRISCGSIGLLVLLSLAIVGLIEVQIKQASGALGAIKSKEQQLAAQKVDIERRFLDLKENQEISRLVVEERLPPVPGWLLNYLGASLPRELVLTRIEIHRVDSLTESRSKVLAPPEGLWEMRLEGVALVTAKTPPAQVKTAFENFSEQLQAGPFYLEIEDSTKYFAPRSVASWISTSGTPAAKANQFFIQGVMRGNTIR